MMNKLALALVLGFVLIGGCGQKQSEPSSQDMPTEAVESAPIATVTDEPGQATEQENAGETAAAPTESISETGEEPPEQTSPSSAQPTFRVGAAPSGPPTSSRFREGTHYKKIVPAQPTNAPPGKVEVAEAFWYGCGHCFSLDPALESWRGKAPSYIEFIRIPAMWNDITRMHARLYYTAESLGKLQELHSLIFREIHVNGNPLNTVDKIEAFFKQHGVSPEEFRSAFSSFSVESKLQRADFLNRRFRVQSVPMIVVNGKYSTDVSDAGGEPALFALINELAAHEHGG